MNILFYFDNPILPNTGGTERAAYLLAKALSEQEGFRISFLSLRDSKEHAPIPSFFRFPHAENLHCNENKTYLETLCLAQGIDCIINCGANQDDSFFFSHDYLSVPSTIVSWISFDVWNSLNHFSSLIKRDFSSLKSTVKTLLRWTCMPYKKRTALRNKKKKYLSLFQGSDKIVFLSQRYVDDAIQLAGQPSKATLYAIPNLLTYEPVQPETLCKENAIVYIGRLVDAPKRIDRLLKIWQKIHPIHPDWHLFLLGDGPEKSALELLATRLKLKNVHFEGNQDPIPYYKKAKILCLTSSHEGMPMVINEALSYGCTPITFNSFHAAEEMLPNIQTGRLIPPFNLRLFADALTDLMSRPYVPPDTKVLARYLPEKVIPKWIQCLHERP